MDVEARRVDGGVVLQIGATAALTRPLPAAAHPRVGKLALRETAAGTEIHFGSGDAQVRAFRLSRPTRIVLDFASANAAPLTLAPDLEPLPVAPLESAPPEPPQAPSPIPT